MERKVYEGPFYRSKAAGRCRVLKDYSVLLELQVEAGL
jgi:hypothetical protein